MSIQDERAGAAQAHGAPSEDELRAAYEAELDRVTCAELAIQATVSLLNVGGRRMGLAPGSEAQRDLDQVRDAIDGVRGLLPVLERRLPARELAPLRDALSQLQLAYTREAQAAASGQEAGAAAPGAPRAPSEGVQTPDKDDAPAPDAERGPGPAESSGRLWVPGR